MCQHIHSLQIGWYGVRHNLAIELVAKNNHILKLVGKRTLVRIAAVPDLGFSEKIGTCPAKTAYASADSPKQQLKLTKSENCSASEAANQESPAVWRSAEPRSAAH